MTEKRPQPYMYVTWLAEHMIGNMMCDFKLWFRANHKNWIKPPNDFDQAAWQIAHTTLLRKMVNESRSAGYRVWVEDQGSFWQTHHGVLISGKPDIVEIDDINNCVLVRDAKTGMPSPTHQAQLQLYMRFLPLQFASLSEYHFKGELVYRDHPNKFVDPPGDDTAFRSAIDNACAVALGTQPFKTPSQHECGWCDIGNDECDERISRE